MNIPSQVSSTTTKLSDSVKSGLQSMSNTITNAKSSVSNQFQQFNKDSNFGLGASKEFLQSNTLVAKFSFLLLVIFVFIILLYLGVYLLTNIISYFTKPSSSPYLIYGMSDGNTPLNIQQDPKSKESKLILRSNNEITGLEYTWSIWLYIKNLPTNGLQYNHIFNKGNNTYDKTSGVATVNNGPGLYLTTNGSSTQQASLHIVIDTIDPNDNMHNIDIQGVPIQKWFHLAIRAKNTIIDTYVNGVVSNRLLLNHVPKQNYENVNICQNGGFSGNISNFRYFDSALNVFDINSIVSNGPNLTLANSAGSSDAHYLSAQWYSYNK